MQDLGDYPLGSFFFTNLLHYVRSGAFGGGKCSGRKRRAKTSTLSRWGPCLITSPIASVIP